MPKKNQYTFRQQIKGFPWGQVIVLAVIRFAEPISFTSLFPYIFFMVQSFQPDMPDNTVSRYAGYLSGAFALSQSVTGIVWGRLSDRYGRRPVILVGLINSACASLLLGFSKTFYMALFARVFGGLMCGNVGVVRTCLGEIAVKRSHQPLAFSVMPILWQIGCIIGPLVGGFLAQPVKEHAAWFEDERLLAYFKPLFIAYPFLLPNLIIASFLAFGAVFAFFFLEETHLLKKKRRSDKIDSETQPLLTARQTAQERRDQQYIEALKDEDFHAWEKILIPRVNRLLIASAINSLQAIVYEELLPVYLCASVLWTPGSSLYGGMGFSSTDMGTILSSCGVVGVSSMIFLFPWVERKFGCILPLHLGSRLIPLFGFICPFYLHLLRFSPTIQLICITIISCGRTLCQSICFPALLLLVNRAAAHPMHLGTINGCSQVCSALGRAIGPILWGYLMDKGQKMHHVELPWWTFCLTTLYGAYQINAIKEKDYAETEEEFEAEQDALLEQSEERNEHCHN